VFWKIEYKNYEKGYIIKHLVLGNGESRAWFNLSKTIDGVTTWGCNAIYRDTVVDNLVSIDYAMQQEIYTSGYSLTNRCFFNNWSKLPSDFSQTFFMGLNIPEELIHESYAKVPSGECVISGKDPVTLEEKIKLAIQSNPNLDVSDLTQKMEKDMGVWITHLEENDMVSTIDFPVGWSAGSTAIHLACQRETEEVYMLGFDLSSYAEPINNIYKGTDNYLPASAKGFNPINWMNELKTVFNEFPNTQFYWVDWSYGTPPCYNIKNVRYLTKAEFYDKLNIL
tara:strand:+ start:5 stop:847 length:843 start_codon:yes stop_codon:yes gene_type:complete